MRTRAERDGRMQHIGDGEGLSNRRLQVAAAFMPVGKVGNRRGPWLRSTTMNLDRPKGVDASRQHPDHDEHFRRAMTDSKRQAHSKVVEMVLNGSKPEEKPTISANGSLGYRSEIRATD